MCRTLLQPKFSRRTLGPSDQPRINFGWKLYFFRINRHVHEYEISNHEFVVPLKPARKILERGTWFDTLEAIKLCNYIRVFNLFFQSDAFFEVTWWRHLNFHRIWPNLNFSKNTQETHAKISHMFDTFTSGFDKNSRIPESYSICKNSFYRSQIQLEGTKLFFQRIDPNWTYEFAHFHQGKDPNFDSIEALKIGLYRSFAMIND